MTSASDSISVSMLSSSRSFFLAPGLGGGGARAGGEADDEIGLFSGIFFLSVSVSSVSVVLSVSVSVSAEDGFFIAAVAEGGDTGGEGRVRGGGGAGAAGETG